MSDSLSVSYYPSKRWNCLPEEITAMRTTSTAARICADAWIFGPRSLTRAKTIPIPLPITAIVRMIATAYVPTTRATVPPPTSARMIEMNAIMLSGGERVNSAPMTPIRRYSVIEWSCACVQTRSLNIHPREAELAHDHQYECGSEQDSRTREVVGPLEHDLVRVEVGHRRDVRQPAVVRHRDE
jgi:hypothetical protein